MRSVESEPPPPVRPARAVPIANRIQRTIRVDVDVDVERDAVDGDNSFFKKDGESQGQGYCKGKPSIEIDLGPRFEIESLRRQLWGQGVAGILLPESELDSGAADGRQSRQGSEDTLVE